MRGSGDRVPVSGGGPFREERTRTGWGPRSHESMGIDAGVQVGGSATQMFYSHECMSRGAYMHIENTLGYIPERGRGRTRCGDYGRASVRERRGERKITNIDLCAHPKNQNTPKTAQFSQGRSQDASVLLCTVSSYRPLK